MKLPVDYPSPGDAIPDPPSPTTSIINADMTEALSTQCTIDEKEILPTPSAPPAEAEPAEAAPAEAAPTTTDPGSEAEYKQLARDRKRKRREHDKITDAMHKHPVARRVRKNAAAQTFFLPLEVDKSTMMQVGMALTDHGADVMLHYSTTCNLENCIEGVVIKDDVIVDLTIELHRMKICWCTEADASPNLTRSDIRMTRLVIKNTDDDRTCTISSSDLKSHVRIAVVLALIGITDDSVGASDVFDYIAILSCLAHPDPEFYSINTIVKSGRRIRYECIANDGSPFRKSGYKVI